MKALFESPLGLIVVLAVVLLFGAKRLPDVARGVGRSLRIFKAETAGLINEEKAPPPVVPPAQLPPVAVAEPAPPVVPAPEKTES